MFARLGQRGSTSHGHVPSFSANGFSEQEPLMAAKVYFELEPSVGFNTVTHKVLKTPILGLRRAQRARIPNHNIQPATPESTVISIIARLSPTGQASLLRLIEFSSWLSN
jgi:hypothetical protein